MNLEESVFKEEFSRDVTNIGHFGTGNFEIRFYRQPKAVFSFIIEKSYN